jgi:hypothetical protein
MLFKAGIGVTPFSSILQSMWKNHSINVCPKCNHKFIDKIAVKRLKMVILFINNKNII